MLPHGGSEANSKQTALGRRSGIVAFWSGIVAFWSGIVAFSFFVNFVSFRPTPEKGNLALT